jgi:pimeloyl-ACP methyl ester carboxylesterase
MEGFRVMRSRIPEFQEAGLSPDELSAQMSERPSPAGPPFRELLHPDSLLAGAASFLDVDARVLDGVLDGRSQPAEDWTQAIPVPTLLIAADPASPDAAGPEGVEALRINTPTAEIHVLEGATHLIHEEVAQRDRMTELVTDFLARLP